MFRGYKDLVKKVDKVYDALFYSKYFTFDFTGNINHGNRIYDLKKELSELREKNNDLLKELKLVYDYLKVSKQTVTEVRSIKDYDGDIYEREVTESKLVAIKNKKN